MPSTHRWQSSAALPIALGVAAIATVLASKPATPSPHLAQVFSTSPAQQAPARDIAILAGAQIPVRYDRAETIVIKPDETVPVTLTVASDVRSAAGTLLVPAGSQVQGELQPLERQQGTQFVAQRLVLPERELAMAATSAPITETKTITRATDPAILQGTSVGAAAAAALAELLGNIDFLEVLAGAGLGAVGEILLSGDREVEAAVIQPETDLTLTLQRDLAL